MIVDGFNIGEIAELILYPFYPDHGGGESERIYIRQLIQKYIQKGNKKDLFTDNDLRDLENFNV